MNSRTGGLVAAPELPDVFPERRPLAGLRGLWRRHPASVAAGAVLLLLLVVAVFAPWIATADPNALSPAQRARVPSAEHWFGTDRLGRDIYSRIVYGARVSLVVGFCVALLATLAGTLLGLLAGFVRWADSLVMRVMDGLMAIPSILLAIALMAVTQGGLANVILALTIAEFPRVCRLVRSVVLSIREQPFIDGAVMSGNRSGRIVFRHVLPNTVSALTVQATYICASAMVLEAILSFIGAGVPTTIPSWGNIMADGRALWQVKPHMVFIPAVFLSVTVLAVNLLGDGLRDALDPRLVKRL
jgi:peptide/nickel transport system permease protein